MSTTQRFFLSRLILTLMIFSCIKGSIYLYYTEDSSTVEFYDCIFHRSFLYCRRPSEPIVLNRMNHLQQCYHGGTPYTFAEMLLNNISVNTVLHEWKSTIEMVELYSRYTKQSSKDQNESYLCQCNDPQSFGKHCEYKLPKDNTFSEIIDIEFEKRGNDEASLVDLYSDILCYTTLKCNFGLLCLDWRDICDGIQQCNFGYDEINCDKLEFNECEDDEYRCMNGMCIPNEYFLDGDYDCMDLTDEIGLFNDTVCTFQQISLECDERLCLSNEWSCGDGQCITNRLSFLNQIVSSIECNSRRDQYFMCEQHARSKLSTLSSGKCYSNTGYEEILSRNRTATEECLYFFKCAFSEGEEVNCPCEGDHHCMDQAENPCPLLVEYPHGALITPYIQYLFKNPRDWFNYIPDLYRINGSIKCRGYMIHHQIELSTLIDFNFRNIENFLCLSRFANTTTQSNDGYDKYCHNNSRTFNNRPYNFLDICHHSKECISAYRIEDGFYNCADKSDEEQKELVTQSCLNMKHYRFRCSADEATCLPVNILGDLWTDCQNQFDESWMGSGAALAKMKCNRQSKDDCELLRHYIQASWTIDFNSIRKVNSTKTIPFRAYCDTFWDFSSKKDEDVNLCRIEWICLKNQWRCHTGQCIKSEWVLDGEWDCSDASDEQAIFFYNHSSLLNNLQLVNQTTLEDRFNELYINQSLSSMCNSRQEFPCFRINTSNPWHDNKFFDPCINLGKVGDGVIDCIGGLDERNTLEYCHQATMLGHHFKCQTSDMCIPYSHICDIRCKNRSDDNILCDNQEKYPNCSERGKDFVCFDGTCAKSGWCDDIQQCQYGEDEFLCEDPMSSLEKPSNSIYRKQKEFSIKYDEQLYQLPNSSTDTNQNKTFSLVKRMNTDVSLPEEFYFTCNRGIDILLHNNSIVCFCPQQYYGDKCQFHHDRLTFIFHLNFSQSIYSDVHDSSILLKLLVLFLYEDQILSSYEFHARPTLEINTILKRIDHVVYSRSNKSLHNKQERYFNRSNIIIEHPYSIRIEAYDIKQAQKAILQAIWQYPIYFDYLPSFRFAKVLRFLQPLVNENPCLSNPCNEHEECHLLMNNQSNYICLCIENYRGNRCSELDEICSDRFCSENALCKPTYRGLLNRNEFPYCICSANKFGFRCDLEYDQCQSNPCKNNGTCFPTSTPNRYFCRCHILYHGDYCELEKATLSFHINENVQYTGIVLQYFYIDFSSLELVLIHQHPYDNLPQFLYYQHIGKRTPEIVLVKHYSIELKVNLHLISMHMNPTTINQTTEINEYNHCQHVSILLPNNREISPIQYHGLCVKNKTLLCFSDDVYLCLCDANHTRAECFIYDHYLDQCSRCLADGLCLKGDLTQIDDFICLCPRCYYGRLCQFNTEQLSFTLDSLIVVAHFYTKIIYLIMVVIIICIGGITNYASFVTFKRSNPRKIGVGNYLFIYTIVSQCSLLILLCKFLHIVLFLSVGHIPCKILSYMLSITMRYTYWLTSWITIERVCSVVFPFKNPFGKPRLAIVISLITFIIVGSMHIHELFFYISVKDPNEQSLCVLSTSQELSQYNRATVLIHYIVPFFIQIISITILIIRTARSRSNTTSNANGFLQHLKRQFKNQKDLYLTPTIIIISGLPHIILSFTFACITLLTWQRHAILVAYFFSHAPQLLGFILFVLPSTSYVQEFQRTRLSKKCPYKWIPLSYKRPTTIRR